MKSRARLAVFLPSILATVLGGTTAILVARQVSSTATSVPICLKTNGQLRVLTGGQTACDVSEQRTDWVVGGQVTDVAIGQGLVGTRQDGTVQLAVDPSLIERGRVFAGFYDGPVPLPRADEQTAIATLDLPPGDFAVFVKLTIVNNRFDDDESSRDRAICRLNALPDFDDAEILVPENGFVFREAAVGLTMQVVHRFSGGGRVIVSCYEDDSILDLYFANLKITAIEASSISNVFVGPQ
jgi:hypothetical protein